MLPLSTAMPVPVLVSALAPLITPLTVSWVPATLSVLSAPRATLPARLPEPALLASVPPLSVIASAPITMPFTSSMAPAATVVPPAVLPNAAALPALSVPALMLVTPV